MSAMSQRALGNSKLFLKKNGPAILTGTGVIGFVATAVLVHKAAVKSKPEIDDIKDDLKLIEDRPIDGNYTKKDQVRDYSVVLTNASKTVARIYWPSLVAGGLSITCIISAHGMLKKQNAALVAAYTALDVAFKAYRQRVVDELGEQKDSDFYRGVIGRREEKTEDGQSCIIEEFGDVIPSRYGRFFDQTCSSWSKGAEWNLTFLMGQQSYANDLLSIRGHMFLNEIYDMLGMERTQAGQVVGWKVDKKGHSRGDGYISFGIHNLASDVARSFVNGQESVIFLDFNVDGPILI